MSYDVISDIIMSNADCTPGREPPSVAASYLGSCYLQFYTQCRMNSRDSLQPYDNIEVEVDIVIK